MRLDTSICCLNFKPKSFSVYLCPNQQQWDHPMGVLFAGYVLKRTFHLFDLLLQRDVCCTCCRSRTNSWLLKWEKKTCVSAALPDSARFCQIESTCLARLASYFAPNATLRFMYLDSGLASSSSHPKTVMCLEDGWFGDAGRRTWLTASS